MLVEVGLTEILRIEASIAQQQGYKGDERRLGRPEQAEEGADAEEGSVASGHAALDPSRARARWEH